MAVSLERAVQRGKLDRIAAEDALGRLVFTGSLDDLADRQLVVEAVIESADAKAEIFAALDKIVEDPEAILATNTSSIPVMRLGMATHRADRVLGLHFFNPVPVLPLVELVASLHTAPETVTAIEESARDTLGKTAICSQDRAGFVVNALLIPYLLSAIRMAESGFATATDVDTGMELGCAHPIRPAEARRPDRPRHRRLHRGVVVRGVQRTALRTAATAPADGRGRTPGPQDRPGVPHVRPGLRGPVRRRRRWSPACLPYTGNPV